MSEADTPLAEAEAPETAAPAALTTANKPTWPKTLQQRVRTVRDQLATAPMESPTLAARYKRKPEKSITQVLDALTELGMVKLDDDSRYRLRDG